MIFKIGTVDKDDCKLILDIEYYYRKLSDSQKEKVDFTKDVSIKTLVLTLESCGYIVSFFGA